MANNWKIISGIVGAGIVASGLIIWLVFFNTPEPTAEVLPEFGTSETRSSVSVESLGGTNIEQPAVQNISTQKVFKISNGPVAGATLIDTTRPTSTIARFVMATNGHAFDFSIDTPGAVAKSISNTTIPGIVRVAWSEGGRGALLQYIDLETIKTAHFALPAAAATTSPSVRIQFLPAGARSVAVSPDGASVAYLLKTQNGSDGYTARADGANAKKLFSLPLTQLLLSWPSQGTLLAQMPAAAGVVGIVFSVDAKTGAATALLSGQGLTATANRIFSFMVYQTNDSSRITYFQNLKTGASQSLSYSPMPELCRWSLVSSTTLHCATPTSYVEPSYLDLWHLGVASVASSLVSYDLSVGRSTILATPGSSDGGEQADIAEIAVSQSDNYLLFIRKSDRSLWGVRLKN